MRLRLLDSSSPEGNVSSFGNCSQSSSDQSFDQVSWTIAISLAILAAISNNLGVNLQKLAWTKKQNNAKQSAYRIVWIGGMMGIILASVFDFVALAFGPQSVIAPLGSLTMVMNGCVAPFMHGEKVRKKIVWTTIVIVCGCAMAVATASHVNVICDLNGIFGYFGSLTFLGYALVITFLSVSMAMFIRHAESVARKHGEDSDAYLKLFKYHRVSYAFLAGLFGAQSVVFARAIGQLVMSTTRGGQFFLVRYETWLILMGLILMIVIQMIYLNKGLERFESSYNVPVFTGTFIVGTAVSGGVVYGEFRNFSELQAILFPLGVCLCVLGVFALAWSSDEEPTEVENDTVGEIPVPPPSAPTRPGSLTIPNRKSSLRLASGGFTPFVLGLDTPAHPISSRISPHHHARDLLTGLRIDDLSPGTSGAFFTGTSAAELREGTNIKTPRTTPKTSAISLAATRPVSAPVSNVSSFTSTAVSAASSHSMVVSVKDDFLKPLTPSSSPSGSTKPPEGFY